VQAWGEPVTRSIAGAGWAAAPGRPARGIRPRLLSGLLAGPIFVGVTAAGVLTREGFDLRRNGLSQLSLGANGWIQVTNFVVAGVLSVAFGSGVRRLLADDRAGTWGPRLIWGYASGIAVTGVFLVDPGASFPPGTPDSIPGLSWHGAVHAVAPPAAFAFLIGACLVFSRRFVARRRWGWVAYCGLTAAAASALIFWPGGGGSIRSAIAVVLTSAWMTALAADLLTELGAREAAPR
jgi:hypothetical protein